MTGPTMEFEERYAELGVVAGVDEAGRGPLAGPVTVAAAILLPGHVDPGVNDSKKLTEKRRESLFAELKDLETVRWAVVHVAPEEIDQVNILQATYLGMERASRQLEPDFCLIDGRPVPNFWCPHEGLVKGDGRSLSIATASIFAKVTRDRFMIDAAKKYPGYGFEKHKGYGTKAHLDALANLGPCPLHRRSFGPVAQLALPLA